MYLAIDPGRDTGWALFRAMDQLLACGVGDPRKFGPGWPVGAGHLQAAVQTVIIERPTIYTSRNMKGDPNDIVTLAIGVGEYKEYFQSRGARVSMIEPRSWKGSLPKDVHHARVWGELGDSDKNVVAESGRLVAPSKRHNMLDAIALGRGAFRFKLWL